MLDFMQQDVIANSGADVFELKDPEVAASLSMDPEHWKHNMRLINDFTCFAQKQPQLANIYDKFEVGYTEYGRIFSSKKYGMWAVRPVAGQSNNISTQQVKIFLESLRDFTRTSCVRYAETVIDFDGFDQKVMASIDPNTIKTTSPYVLDERQNSFPLYFCKNTARKAMGRPNPNYHRHLNKYKLETEPQKEHIKEEVTIKYDSPQLSEEAIEKKVEVAVPLFNNLVTSEAKYVLNANKLYEQEIKRKEEYEGLLTRIQNLQKQMNSNKQTNRTLPRIKQNNIQEKNIFTQIESDKKKRKDIFAQIKQEMLKPLQTTKIREMVKVPSSNSKYDTRRKTKDNMHNNASKETSFYNQTKTDNNSCKPLANINPLSVSGQSIKCNRVNTNTKPAPQMTFLPPADYNNHSNFVVMPPSKRNQLLAEENKKMMRDSIRMTGYAI